MKKKPRLIIGVSLIVASKTKEIQYFKFLIVVLYNFGTWLLFLDFVSCPLGLYIYFQHKAKKKNNNSCITLKKT